MRRLFVQSLQTGNLPLDPAQAHHARNVLRLAQGMVVELFDAAGKSASGSIASVDPMVVRVESINPTRSVLRLVVASAVPKGDRADWLVEKLSEVGVSRWIPLRTERSVVHPEGAGKLERWERIALESAKQSKRSGVMEIDPLTPLKQIMDDPEFAKAIALSTGEGANALHAAPGAQHAALLIGPEGGWTPGEESRFADRGLTLASLGPTILRIETAAVVAAGIVSALAWERSE